LTSQSYGDSNFFWGGGRHNPKTPELIDEIFGMSDYVSDSAHAKVQNEHPIGDVVVYA